MKEGNNVVFIICDYIFVKKFYLRLYLLNKVFIIKYLYMYVFIIKLLIVLL